MLTIVTYLCYCFIMALAVNSDMQMNLSRAAVVVGTMILANQSDDGITRIGVKKIIELTGLSRTTIWRGMRELKEARLVTEFLPGHYEVSRDYGWKMSNAEELPDIAHEAT